MEKKILRLCGRLDCDPLHAQILKRPDFTFIFYNHHLTTVQIWSRPLIFFFTSIHRVAAPQAVYCSIGQQFILVFPDNLLKSWLIAQPLKCFPGKLHIDTFIFAITCLIAVRFEIIHSNNNLRQSTVRSILFLSATSAQHKTAGQKKCGNTNSFSPGTEIIFLFSSHIQFLFLVYFCNPPLSALRT